MLACRFACLQTIHNLCILAPTWRRFDGYRFDGVTSMMYHHHGLQTTFTGEARGCCTFVAGRLRICRRVRSAGERVGAASAAACRPPSLVGAGARPTAGTAGLCSAASTSRRQRLSLWQPTFLIHFLCRGAASRPCTAHPDILSNRAQLWARTRAHVPPLFLVTCAGNYDEYFGMATDVEAVVYLMLVSAGLFPAVARASGAWVCSTARRWCCPLPGRVAAIRSIGPACAHPCCIRFSIPGQLHDPRLGTPHLPPLCTCTPSHSAPSLHRSTQ